jgi:predicted permease
VWAGVAAAGGVAVNIGSVLIVNATQPYAIAGTAAGLTTVGTAIATAINTSSPTAIVAGAARVVTPVSMSGITTATALLIDSLVSGIQETVTPTAVTATTFTATFANGHAAGFGITGPNANQAKGTSIIANNASATGLVAAFIEVQT